MDLEVINSDETSVFLQSPTNRYFRVGNGIFGTCIEEYKLITKDKDNCYYEKISSLNKFRIFKNFDEAKSFLENLDEDGTL